MLRLLQEDSSVCFDMRGTREEQDEPAFRAYLQQYIIDIDLKEF